MYTQTNVAEFRPTRINPTHHVLKQVDLKRFNEVDQTLVNSSIFETGVFEL